MGLFRTVSEINGDFGQKLLFFTAVYLAPPLKRFPLEFCNNCGAQNWDDSPTGLSEKCDDMSICLDTGRRADGIDRNNIAVCVHSMLMRQKRLITMNLG